MVHLLSPKSPARVATAFEPLGLAVSPDSKSVYVTNSPPEHPTGPPHVTQYDVKAGGRLSPKNPATVATGLGPRDVAVSPDGKSAYVITHEYPDFSVYQYDIGAGGRLAPKSPAKVAADSFPWAMAVSPDGKSVYVTSDDPGNDISQYTIGPGGRLSRKSPATVPAGRSPSGIAVSPDSRSVYVDIASDNDVAQYNVGAGGRLHPKSPATVPTAAGPYGVALTPRTPGWEGWVRNPASGCMARVQVPYLDGNRQVTAYTEVSCPRPTKLTIRSRLRSDYPSTDATVAQQGCLTGCVVEEPQGHRFFRLTCPKSASRQDHQPYYSDILIYPGANSGAATRERSRDKFLSPFCAH